MAWWHLLFIHYFKVMRIRKSLQDIAIICLLIIMICLYFIWIKHNHGIHLKAFIAIAFLIFISSVFSESFSNFFLKNWLRLGMFLGKINSFLILSILFFLVLFPFALLRKLFSKDQLFAHYKDKKSRFFLRRHTYIASDFEKIW